MARLPSRDSYQSRLDDMRRAEFGSPLEIVLRFAVIAVAAIVLLLFIDRQIALAWGAAYLVFEGGLAVQLLRLRQCPARFRYWGALASYVLAGLCFLALPLYLVAEQMTPGTTFAGAAGLVGYALYTLQRPQRESGLLVADCALVSIMMLSLVVLLQPLLNDWTDRLLVAFVTLAVLGYYIGSMIVAWRLQADLRTAQKRYASAQMARALGQFVGGVAHEFNNQLTVILGNLELFETLPDAHERQAAIEESRAAAGRAAVTVRQLMVASGRTRLSPAPIPMEAFLFDLAEVLSDMLGPDMRVETAPPTDPLVALADRDMLETCAIQLCLNAQEATGGHGTIRITAERRGSAKGLTPSPEAPPPYVALIVEDNGPGVPEEALPRLAEPFYTTKPPHEGRGLGLSSVAGFTRQSGGGMMLDRPLRGGLRVVLYLVEAAGNTPGTSDAQLSGSW
ncbi:sensor histidine kinase [Mameliella sp. MMSF_3455]|uniref:sensor histidine kinase n=1 Tax=Mameliella sp. MMSF_3455 TaxID=3046714 RepID=UPI00273EA8A7|nr:ATP-binding protein [Mameliella sp. MMSF_3455]